MKLLLLTATLTSVIGSALAAPVICPSAGTVQNLINLSGVGNGCLINGVVFNNFTFTPSATGSGLLPSASQVSYSLDNPGTTTGNGQLIYGFEFNPNLSVLGVGSQDILLNYTIIAPSAIISSIHLLMNAAISGTGTAMALVSEGPNLACKGVGTLCQFLPIMSVTPFSPTQELAGIGPYTEIDVSKDIHVISTTANGFATISQVRDSVDLITNVPEPASAVLATLGVLFGMGRLVHRRRRCGARLL